MHRCSSLTCFSLYTFLLFLQKAPLRREAQGLSFVPPVLSKKTVEGVPQFSPSAYYNYFLTYNYGNCIFYNSLAFKQINLKQVRDEQQCILDEIGGRG